MNRSGVNWTYAYNELSLPTTATLALDSRTYAQGYTYSNAAALTGYTLLSGKAVTQGVDGLGRVTSVTVDSTGIASGFSYHPNGSVAGVNYGNGQVFSQTLTPRQQTDRLRSVKGAELPVDLTYAYTARSQIASVNDQTVANIDQAFTYDGIGRLTASTGPWGAGTFQYDALGNIRQRAVGARTVGMNYNAANQLSAHTDTALAVPVPVSMTALYDGTSRRVKQVAGGVTRYSVYDASGTLIEIDEVGGAKTDYIRASGMTLARIAGSCVTWLHHDHLGSAVAGTNASGAVVWRESEQPFGEDWITAAANDNQAGYTGHVEDAATGLTYMQARYYDPVIGRFLSIDPVGFTPTRPGMFNRYAYAANDPINKWDPDGRSCLDVRGRFVCQIDDGRDKAIKAYGLRTVEVFEREYSAAVNKLARGNRQATMRFPSPHKRTRSLLVRGEGVAQAMAKQTLRYIGKEAKDGDFSDNDLMVAGTIDRIEVAKFGNRMMDLFTNVVESHNDPLGKIIRLQGRFNGMNAIYVIFVHEALHSSMLGLIDQVSDAQFGRGQTFSGTSEMHQNPYNHGAGDLLFGKGSNDTR